MAIVKPFKGVRPPQDLVEQVPFFIFSGYTYVKIGRIQKSFGRSYP